MATVHGLPRRTFLRLGLIGFGGIGLLAACAPQPPAAKPADSTAPPPATAQTPAAAPPPAAPAAAKPPAETKPAAAKPAEAAKPAAEAVEKPGRHMIGKLEGPTIMADAPRPARLAEAPMLAELVKAGKLPPVEQRVPEEPEVLKPLRETGKFGATWRRAFRPSPGATRRS